MDRFVARKNIEHFRQMLAQAHDLEERDRLERLLNEAYQQLRQAESAHRLNPPNSIG